MRKLAFCIALLLPFVYIYAQYLDYYYLEIKEGYEFGEIQKTENTVQTSFPKFRDKTLDSFLIISVEAVNQTCQVLKT